MNKILKSFFFSTSKSKFQPVYFWITVMMLMVITMMILRFCRIGDLSDTLILGVLGFIVTWLGLYNYNKKSQNNQNSEE